MFFGLVALYGTSLTQESQKIVGHQIDPLNITFLTSYSFLFGSYYYGVLRLPGTSKPTFDSWLTLSPPKQVLV